MSAGRDARPSRAERFFRRLLKLLPEEFRGDFADNMAADFADRDRETFGAGRVRFVSREFAGLLMTAIRQRGEDAWRDAMFAVRLMRRTPAATIVALVMLALGTGANAAVFSVIDAVLLRTPFDHPERIYFLGIAPGSAAPSSKAISVDLFRRVQTGGELEAVAGISGGSPTMRGPGIDPHRLNLECVSAGFFPVVGGHALIGRGFSASEDVAGAPPVLVASYEFWRRELGGTATAIGRVVMLDDQPVTIIGVMPRGFNGPYSRNGIDGWAPLGPGLDQPGASGCAARSSINVIVRTSPGAVVAAIEGRIAGMVEGASPARASLEPITEQTVGEVRTPLLILLGAVACVLFIACANVANMLVERAMGRRRELAMRLALGASRARLFRQTFVEALVLCCVGAISGIAVAYATLGLMLRVIPTYVPHLAEIELNPRVLGAALGVALVFGLGVGLLPAMQALGLNVNDGLKDGAPGATRAAGRRTRYALIVVELSLAVVLLIGAALMLRTFIALDVSRPGFDPSRKAMVFITMRDASNQTFRGAALTTFVDALTVRIAARPDVAGVSVTTYVPLSGSVSVARMRLADAPVESRRDVYSGAVSANYFDEMAMPIRRGRGFAASDGPGAPAVAVVNETLAARLLPGRDPIGAMVTTDLAGAPTTRLVIGVVGDVRNSGSDTRMRPEIYWPFAQDPVGTPRIVVRSKTEAGAALERSIRAAVAEVDSRQLVTRFETFDAMLYRNMQRPRFGLSLLGAFAGLAILLAVVGLSAAIAWTVTERRREIGVRVALGATRRQVVAPFIRRGLVLGVCGVGVGLSVATAVSRVMESWVYGVKPVDPSTFALVAGGVLALAVLGAWWPARRATAIDPIVTLREG